MRCESRDGAPCTAASIPAAACAWCGRCPIAAACAGSTWGADGRGVWVTDGCRAEFELGAGYGAHAPACSAANRPTTAPATATSTPATACRSCTSFRAIPASRAAAGAVTRDSVWVSRGCRAEFSAGDRYYNERVDYRRY